MRKLFLSFLLLAAGVLSAVPSSAAQDPARGAQDQQPPVQQQPPAGATMTICDQAVPPPVNLPPAGSAPVVYQLMLCFPKQQNRSVVEPQTYRYYIQTPTSRSSANQWVPYDDKTEQSLKDDFKRLWGTTFLDDLSIDVLDYPFTNGVVGKIVVYNIEERQRVKIVDYEGNKHVEQTKIDEKLKEENAAIRLDSFLDQSQVQKVRTVIKNMLAEKGYEAATITPVVAPIQSGTKNVHVTFKIEEGPKVKIRRIVFVGNKAVGNRTLKRHMKNNKQHGLLSFVTSKGTYQRAKYEEDADSLVEYYRDHGYVAVRVGEPELKFIEDSADKQTRWLELRIPINEGDRYKVASVSFDGNKVVKSEYLKTLFKLKPGDWYSDKAIRKGMEKAREAYGTVGYFEFTGYPDLKPEGEGQPATDGAAATQKQADGSQKPESTQKQSEPAQKQGEPAQKQGEPAQKQEEAPKQAAKSAPARKGPPKVDVVLRLQEGKQYFVNRITFQGNTTTRDNVVRREMRLVEGGIFNTEALKYSVKRINQLGYFKNLEGGKDLQVEKTADTDNKVDVTLKVEEQNRNQITFGAGVSQFEGFFGQLAFQTANFMGKGETFSVSLQAGSRAQLYQVGFSEPFLFDRNMTGGINLYKRRLQYLYQFTEASVGGDLTFGVPVGAYGRGFVNYSYQRSKVVDINPIFLDPAVIGSNPYLQEQLLIGMNGSRTVSKITPSYVYNSVDQPLFPTTGRRYTVAVDLAGVGGDTNFYKPLVEGVWYFKQTNRTSFGFRAQGQYLSPFTGSTAQLPIFERLVMGGEYSVRGFDIRSIGPKAENSFLVIGGNKSLLFNAEYLISIAGPVRLVLFADAGQVRDTGQKFAMNEFKTSTGAEIRFFMPVLNVPFRLIMAYNPNREGVLDNSFQPQKKFSFRFAVGSTF